MANTYKVLGQTNAVKDYISALYTVPSTVSALVSTIIICNQGAGTATFNICIQPSGADIATKHYLSYNTSIAAYDTIPLTLGLTLGPNDVISVWANTDTVSFGAFGAEMTLATGEGPVISNLYITDSGYNATTATAVGISGGYVKLTGSGFITGAAVYVDTTTATSTVVMNSTEIWSQVPAATSGTHMLTMFNPSGTGSKYAQGISYSPIPVWTTGTYVASNIASVQLLATGDAPLTYSILNGSSLPSGLSLSSSGLITGTVSTGTYVFYAVVSDLQLQTAVQQITLSVAIISSVEYLVVAGGGGGGYDFGGGGGAGGLLSATTSTISPNIAYAVTVGGGGVAGIASTNGGPGTNSSMVGTGTSIISIGGGGGRSFQATLGAGNNGGSGGGARGNGANSEFGTGITGQGYNGGSASSGAGGGGGAGGVGVNGSANAGNGGTGTFTTLISTTTAISLSIGQYVTATNAVYFAGGGGGGGYVSFGVAAGTGGSGGGGTGNTNGSGTDGIVNTGGGGGGGSGSAGNGGTGGKGVVVIRHTTAYNSATSIVGTQTTVVNTGGYWIYAFRSSGSIQW